MPSLGNDLAAAIPLLMPPLLYFAIFFGVIKTSEVARTTRMAWRISLDARIVGGGRVAARQVR